MKLCFSVLLVVMSCLWALAQGNTSPVSVTLSSQLPSPLRPGSRGSLVVWVKNVLQPRQPIQLAATVTYEYGDQTFTASSNSLTLQVVQPVVVKQVNVSVPVGILLNGVNVPVQLNATLLEGEETSVTIPITVQ